MRVRLQGERGAGAACSGRAGRIVGAIGGKGPCAGFEWALISLFSDPPLPLPHRPWSAVWRPCTAAAAGARRRAGGGSGPPGPQAAGTRRGDQRGAAAHRSAARGADRDGSARCTPGADPAGALERGARAAGEARARSRCRCVRRRPWAHGRMALRLVAEIWAGTAHAFFWGGENGTAVAQQQQLAAQLAAAEERARDLGAQVAQQQQVRPRAARWPTGAAGACAHAFCMAVGGARTPGHGGGGTERRCGGRRGRGRRTGDSAAEPAGRRHQAQRRAGRPSAPAAGARRARYGVPLAHPT